MAKRSRFRRILPPAVMVFGLFLFGASLIELSSEADPRQAVPLHAESLTVDNGTAALLYPFDNYLLNTGRVDVDYAFPAAPGTAYVVECVGADALRRGAAPAEPFLVFEGQRSGSFVVSPQTLPLSELYSKLDPRDLTCDLAIAFAWPATDPGPNRPEVTVLYYGAGLGAEDFFFLALLMGGGALTTLLGGLAWARGAAPPSQPPDGSTVEALRASLDQVLVQLERTRKHLLFAGILGVFLWYPFLVPWAWQRANAASVSPWIPWAVAGFTLAFLVALTALWAREFVRLDRQLDSWRSRLGQLRDREQDLMESLEQGG